jgi:hypothetical protein
MLKTNLELPSNFPHNPPEGYTYEVEQFKKNVVSIWTCNHSQFSYNSGAVAKCIWGFYNTKKGCYSAPINHTKCGKEVDISNTSPYTAMQLNLNPLMSAFS